MFALKNVPLGVYLVSFIFTVSVEQVSHVGSNQFIVSIYYQVFALEYSSLFLVKTRVYMASRGGTVPTKNGPNPPTAPSSHHLN